MADRILVSRSRHQSAKEKEIELAYDEIAAGVTTTYLLDRVTYLAPVNFTEAAGAARHRWFPYKEGFSPAFVRDTLKRFMPARRAGLVLDPFAGVGTTVLEAARIGHNGVGLDVSPLACFVASTKSLQASDQTIRDIRRDLKELAGNSLSAIAPLPQNETVVSYFEPEYLEAILKIKAFANSRRNSDSAALFKLAFLGLIERFSTHRKAGNGLKRKTRFRYRDQALGPLEQVRAAAGVLVASYLSDLEVTPLSGHGEIRNESSLEANFGDTLFDCVLTSPPYANCFDYSKIYLCELWLGDFFESRKSQQLFRSNSVRSHVHARWPARFAGKGSAIVDSLVAPLLSEQELWSTAIPEMISGYFSDLGQLLSRISENLRQGAQLGFVVSNSAYAGIPIATDLLICEIATKVGYVPKEIIVYRKIIPSSQQFVKMADKNYLRESLVVLEKQ
ncbi:MAG: hypothetical protein AB7O31_12170 [Burkholderiales bacterium]